MSVLEVEVVELRLRVMASETLALLVAPVTGAAGSVADRLAELERRWSRFVPTSDISRLNRAAGAWLRVSNDTIRLIDTMQRAHDVTAGSFDPTFLELLLSAGYSSSIDDPDRITMRVEARNDAVSVHDVEIDPSASAIRAPRGLSLDPGGIGKGFAADLLVTELLAAGTAGALVSIGGDIAAAGTPPSLDGWTVHVDDPHRPGSHTATLSVSGGGVATSSTRSRRWTHAGTETHHVIDPSTGTVSDTDLATVTVIASSGWLAEAHASAAILTGTCAVADYFRDNGLSGVAIGAAGGIWTSDDISGTGTQS